MKSRIVFIIITLFIWHCPDASFAACSVSSTPVTFGSYDVFSANPLDIPGTITVSCNHSPPPIVTVSIGQSTNSGGFEPRAMKLTTGSELLYYNLYLDSSRATVWGDGSGNTGTVSSKVFKSRPQNFTVYGRLPSLQNAGVGSYSETVTVTIIW